MRVEDIMSAVVLIVCCACFTGCEQHIAMETVVHENGSLSRTIILREADSSKVLENIFGINRDAGWKTAMEPVEDNKYDIHFSKTFASVEAINAEMNPRDEALFKVKSELTERFRWFYTYYRYSDTYVSLNRMRGVRQEDYFTEEDFSFIDRLPAEGKPITKADSFFLAKLNDRIYEDFAARAYYEENFSALLQALDSAGAAPQWKDSLLRMKEQMFEDEIIKNEDFDGEDFPLILERINAPVDMVAIRRIHKELMLDFERRVDFMTTAASARIVHGIHLPWMITDTNADSVVLNRAFWKPPVIKFVLKDHTMYAEGRSFNAWAGAVSVIVAIGTILLFFQKKRVFAISGKR